MAIAMNAVAIIGSPAGSIGVITTAKTAQVIAKNFSLLDVSRGQSKPKNAAGTAESRPNARISPIA
jgi:hypothetical protein